MIVTVTLNTSVDRAVEVPGLGTREVLSGEVLAEQPAGKGVNVSHYLGALGRRSVATGFVGRAEHELFRDSLLRRGADEALIPVAGRTRHNVTYLDPEQGRETHIRESGFTVSPADLIALQKRLGELVQRGFTVVFAGSIPPGVSRSALVSLCLQCQQAGAEVVLDSGGAALREALIMCPVLITPNLQELGELTGAIPTSREEACAQSQGLLRQVRRVLVTLGEQGAVLCTPEGNWHARAQVAELRSSVGCGDALLAGYLDARLDGGSPPDRLRRGVAAGGAAVRHVIAGDLDRRDVWALERQIQVHELPLEPEPQPA